MKQNKAHLLSPSKSISIPKRLIFFDTETVPIVIDDTTAEHVLKLGVAQYAETDQHGNINIKHEIVFRTCAEFVALINAHCKTKSLTYLVAHNVQYDITILKLISNLSKCGWKITGFYFKSTTFILRFARGSAKIIILDNMNLFAGRLETWGEIVGLKKSAVDFATVTDDDLIAYCKTDVGIMVRSWQMWLDFLRENNCGKFCLTTASTAFNTWRHGYLSGRVYVHDDKSVLALERQGYHGGRVEVLHRGRLDGDRYYYLDVNNLYGWVMSNYPMPVGLSGHCGSIGVHWLIERLGRYAVVADVLLNVDKNPYPIKYKSHTCYPVGRFRAVLTTPELLFALRNGWIEQVHEMSWYRQDKMFADYVDHFRSLRERYRQAGNTSYAEICKLLINALYGKFGQTGLDQKIIGVCDIDEIGVESGYDMDRAQMYHITKIGGQIFEVRQQGESYHSMPAVAAHVTAYGRMRLFELLQRVPDGHAYYMDTDSIIVDQTGLTALADEIDESTIGKLKIETESSWLEIWAAKEYYMDGRSKHKGVRNNALEIAPQTYRQEQWSRIPGMIRQGDLDTYTVKTVTKRLTRQVFSGVVSSSGWVEPFALDLVQGETVLLPGLRPLPLPVQPADAPRVL